MIKHGTFSLKAGRKLPLLSAACVFALGLPTAGLAVVTLGEAGAGTENAGLAIFTPATVDPDLAMRIADRAGQDGVRFTPADKNARERTVTVAVRVDDDTARAISLRSAIDAVPGASEGISALNPARYNLGIARGYESFAKTEPKPLATVDQTRRLSLPDLSNYSLSPGSADDKPSRFQPRIALEGNGKLGRADRTIESVGGQSVDLGGAYSITRNLDVTAGVRLSQERDRLTPLTDTVQDSQAVYVGTQFRF